MSAVFEARNPMRLGETRGVAMSKLRSSTTGRPNTQIRPGLLKESLVLCCGEDLHEFVLAISAAFGRPRRLHAYRCYAVLELKQVSFIWTGIGSGCLEPLLCEIFDEPALRRIILVGTAGAVAKRAKLGVATPIREARVACAGISPKRRAQKPNWLLAAGTETQTIVSTDNYYGFTLSNKWPTPGLWAADSRLPKTVAKALALADLVDMETGQFYHLCRTLRPDLQFLAIKGAANPLRDFSRQTLHSQSVLCHALAMARGFLA